MTENKNQSYYSDDLDFSKDLTDEIPQPVSNLDDHANLSGNIAENLDMSHIVDDTQQYNAGEHPDLLGVNKSLEGAEHFGAGALGDVPSQEDVDAANQQHGKRRLIFIAMGILFLLILISVAYAFFASRQSAQITAPDNSLQPEVQQEVTAFGDEAGTTSGSVFGDVTDDFGDADYLAGDEFEFDTNDLPPAPQGPGGGNTEVDTTNNLSAAADREALGGLISGTVRDAVRQCIVQGGYVSEPQAGAAICEGEVNMAGAINAWPSIDAYGSSWGGCGFDVDRAVNRVTWCYTDFSGAVFTCPDGKCYAP